MEKIIRLSVLSLTLLMSTSVSIKAQSEIGKKIWALNWVVGPATNPTVGNADIFVPQAYNFLDNADTKKLNELMQNPSDDSVVNTVAPDTFQWQAYFSYDDLGYVKDDESIDADAILKSIKQGTEQSNVIRKQKGWPTLNVVGWRYPPHYDQKTNRLVWAVEARDENGSVINYTEKILGRRGVTTALLVANPENLDGTVKEFESLIDGYRFRQGETYSEFKSGDRVAEIGLTALIVGGAAAAVIKSGIGKGLFKMIGFAALAGLAAIGTFLKSLFSRK